MDGLGFTFTVTETLVGLGQVAVFASAQYVVVVVGDTEKLAPVAEEPTNVPPVC